MRAVVKKNSHAFHTLLRSFFLKWLMSQKKVSPATIQTYKDTFRLLLKYLHDKHGIKSSSITMETILEYGHTNKYRTINTRLAAIKSFMEYVSYECPEYSEIIRKIKAISFRKIDTKEVCYLTKTEINSLLNSCKTNTSEGRRDYLMLLLLYNSGMQVSEMISVQVKDTVRGDNGKYYLKINGKGRKERIIPLWRTTTEYLADFIVENNLQENDYLLSGRNVNHLTRSGVRYRIDCIVKRALSICL